MTKQVRETAAGKSIAAYVILNKKGTHVASVNVHYSDSGVVSVDVWNIGDSACERSARAMGLEIDESGKIASGPNAGKFPYVVAGLQQSRAGGYGYDKLTAALAGLVIDGIRLTDHCGERLAPPKGRKAWPESAREKLRRKGYSLANYSPELGGYFDAYRQPGLRILESFGYRVIQAI